MFVIEKQEKIENKYYMKNTYIIFIYSLTG